jgi:hypothetical protein
VAVLALLDGSVLALKVNQQAARTAVTQQVQQGTAIGSSSRQLLLQGIPADQQQVQKELPKKLLSVAWQYKGAAPIFSCPAVDEAAALVLVAAVDGTVCGLGLGTGQVVWRAQVQGHVFADLLLLCDRRRQDDLATAAAVQSATAAAAAAADTGGATEAAGDSDVGESCLVLATQSGWLLGLDSHNGQQVRRAARQGQPWTCLVATTQGTLMQLTNECAAACWVAAVKA